MPIPIPTGSPSLAGPPTDPSRAEPRSSLTSPADSPLSVAAGRRRLPHCVSTHSSRACSAAAALLRSAPTQSALHRDRVWVSLAARRPAGSGRPPRQGRRGRAAGPASKPTSARVRTRQATSRVLRACQALSAHSNPSVSTQQYRRSSRSTAAYWCTHARAVSAALPSPDSHTAALPFGQWAESLLVLCRGSRASTACAARTARPACPDQSAYAPLGRVPLMSSPR